MAHNFKNPRYYLVEKAIREAIRCGDMFNLIDSYTGLKADFWPLKADADHQMCFRRRKKHTILGQDTFIAKPEDVILTKLEWYKLSGRSKPQFEDALGVYEAQFNNLNIEYLYKWAEYLGVRDLIDKLIEESSL